MTQTKSSSSPFRMWLGAFPAVVFVLWVLVAIPALGQNRNAGEIRGTVLDASGAAVPGVSVEAKNVATGIVTTATTLDVGVYDIPWVETGPYTVTFTKEGFNQVVRNDVEVHVGAITVDAALEVGSVATQVTVTSHSDLLQTETSDKHVVLSPVQVTELPHVGNSWFSYTLLIPGANPGKGSPGSFSNGSNVGINGSESNSSNWLMDGGTAGFGQAGNPDNLQLPLQAIEEINIVASDASAEYGNWFSTMNQIGKGGTNQFHGSAFEFVQNNIFNARNFFSPTTAPQRWNEFGGTIGGPIKKDKVFFFFSYQRNPTVSHSASFSTYPTDAMRAGDFSAPGFPTIYDPATTVLVGGQHVRQPFPGNKIPQNRFDSVAVAIQQYYPKPTMPGLFNNYFSNLASPDAGVWSSTKIDANISAKQRLMFSGMVYTNKIFQDTPACPLNCINIFIHEYTGQITDTWSISPTKVNEFRLSANRAVVYNWGPDYLAGYPQKIGLKNAVIDAFPNIDIGGAVSPSGLGTGPSNGLWETVVQAADTFAWIKGRHTIKMGGEFDIWRTNQDPFLFVDAGNFSFSGIFSRNPADPSSVGLGYADFLLGLPQTWSVRTGPLEGARDWTLQMFVQDSYKVRPNLTLNYGVRYLDQQGWTEQHDQIAQFDPTIINKTTGTLGAVWYGGENGRRAVTKSHPAVFAPRVGFTWSPKTAWVVRGAYGICYFPWTEQNYFGSGQGQDGWFTQGFQTSTDLITPIFQLAQGPPPPVLPPADPHTASNDLLNGQSLLYNPYIVPMTYMHQWHLGVQRQLGDYAIDVGYVGSRIANMGFGADINQVPENLLGPGDAQSRRPYPQFAGITGVLFNGHSSYNSLQISVRKKFSGGFSLLANYTYSHSLDTATGEGGNGMLRTDIVQNSFNPNANYGSSSTDIRHNLNGAIVYELPVGRGRRFLNKGGIADGFLGGWQASTILLIHSGLPFTPVMGTANLSGALAGSWFPDRLANGSISSPTTQRWFDPSAFAEPAPFTFGNSGRNILYGPGFDEVNFSLAKSFAIPIRGDQTRLQIRMDATDFFNHPNFGQPNTAIGTTGAGIVSSALTSRVIQLGAVFRF